jgi:hypothetical protein
VSQKEKENDPSKERTFKRYNKDHGRPEEAWEG